MKKLFFFMLAVILDAGDISERNDTVQNYTAVHFCFVSTGGKEIAVIRSFEMNSKRFFLAVNTASLHTEIIPAIESEKTPCKNSRYARLLKAASTPPFPLQNDGITHGENNGMFITTDLCPSSKNGYERRLYKKLIKHFPNPVPVTLFITSRWIKAHEDAFEELKNWDAEGNLNITWGNHTARHTYHPGRPLRENFVLSAEVSLDSEIMKLEKDLIGRGVVPSVFFRFPGLVSNRISVETVTKYGLVIIGSDAWLAKGKKPKHGSIILVHGNGNESIGVDMLLDSIRNGSIGTLCDLKDIVVHDDNETDSALAHYEKTDPPEPKIDNTIQSERKVSP